MTEKQIGKEWTKSDILKSALLFTLHVCIFILVVAGMLLWFTRKWSGVSEGFHDGGANYLYALFCVVLLFIVAYFYFFFEDREVLQKGKLTALVFTVLDLYLIAACLIGYNLAN